jgi:hypothetical protein
MQTHRRKLLTKEGNVVYVIYDRAATIQLLNAYSVGGSVAHWTSCPKMELAATKRHNGAVTLMAKALFASA